MSNISNYKLLAAAAASPNYLLNSTDNFTRFLPETEIGGANEKDEENSEPPYFWIYLVFVLVLICGCVCPTNYQSYNTGLPRPA